VRLHYDPCPRQCRTDGCNLWGWPVSSNVYHFMSHWRVATTIEEVSDVLGEAEELPRWWPSVYLCVDVLEPGDADGIGKVVALHTRGWLPYTLRWTFRVDESRPP